MRRSRTRWTSPTSGSSTSPPPDSSSTARTYVEKGAGGVYLEGPLCGHKRWDVKSPFPEVVETAPEHVEDFAQAMKFADGRPGKIMYVDFFALKPGAKGEVRAYGPDGKKPLAVRGAAGLGKVYFNGTFNLGSLDHSRLWASNANLMFDGSGLTPELLAGLFRVYGKKGAHRLQPNCTDVATLLDALRLALAAVADGGHRTSSFALISLRLYALGCWSPENSKLYQFVAKYGMTSSGAQ